jgi:hypothetical protein
MCKLQYLWFYGLKCFQVAIQKEYKDALSEWDAECHWPIL